VKNAKQTNSINSPKGITFIPMKGPWEIINMDLIGLLLESAGFNGILVIVDHFSKMACYTPINMNITAQGVAKVS